MDFLYIVGRRVEEGGKGLWRWRFLKKVLLGKLCSLDYLLYGKWYIDFSFVESFYFIICVFILCGIYSILNIVCVEFWSWEEVILIYIFFMWKLYFVGVWSRYLSIFVCYFFFCRLFIFIFNWLILGFFDLFLRKWLFGVFFVLDFVFVEYCWSCFFCVDGIVVI